MKTHCNGYFQHKQGKKNGYFPHQELSAQNGHLLQTSVGVPGSERSGWVTVCLLDDTADRTYIYIWREKKRGLQTKPKQSTFTRGHAWEAS
jgi:hypothetical protein